MPLGASFKLRGKHEGDILSTWGDNNLGAEGQAVGG